MNHRTAFACLKTAKRCYESEDRRETYVAVLFGLVAMTLLYREYSAVRRTFKKMG